MTSYTIGVGDPTNLRKNLISSSNPGPECGKTSRDFTISGQVGVKSILGSQNPRRPILTPIGCRQRVDLH